MVQPESSCVLMKFRGGYLERNHILIVEFNPSFGHEYIQAYAGLTESHWNFMWADKRTLQVGLCD